MYFSTAPWKQTCANSPNQDLYVQALAKHVTHVFIVSPHFSQKRCQQNCLAPSIGMQLHIRSAFYDFPDLSAAAPTCSKGFPLLYGQDRSGIVKYKGTEMIYIYINVYTYINIIYIYTYTSLKFLLAFCPPWRCSFTASPIPCRLGHRHIKSSIGKFHVRCNCNLKSHDVVMHLQCRRQSESKIVKVNCLDHAHSAKMC